MSSNLSREDISEPKKRFFSLPDLNETMTMYFLAFFFFTSYFFLA